MYLLLNQAIILNEMGAGHSFWISIMHRICVGRVEIFDEGWNIQVSLVEWRMFFLFAGCLPHNH